MPEWRNPVQGVRARKSAFNLAGVGSTEPSDRPVRTRLVRGRSANPIAANSSTMKGPRGLASEFCGRRCQTANDFSRWVRGRFYVRSPEIGGRVSSRHDACRDDAGSGEPRIRLRSRRVMPASDVSHRAKTMTNAGTAAAAGMVSGAWAWSPGCVPKEAVAGECGLSRSLRRSEWKLAASRSDVLGKAVETRWCRTGWCRRHNHDERADEQ